MKKDLLSHLLEELTQLQNEQKKINLPVPASPKEVIQVITKVIEEHEVSADDLAAALTARNLFHADASSVTPDEMETLKRLIHNESEQ